mmetsp:Transcript_11054/g.33908  ORF Transcript_11054/g.33908 Transcript_11054/m.33908 type:complete len:406 (+) Transcript_11054:153-1370(+)
MINSRGASRLISLIPGLKQRKFFLPYVPEESHLPYRPPSGYLIVDKMQGWTLRDVMQGVQATITANLLEQRYFDGVKCGWRELITVQMYSFMDRASSGICVLGINRPSTDLSESLTSARYEALITLGRDTESMTWPPRRILQEKSFEHVKRSMMDAVAKKMARRRLKTKMNLYGAKQMTVGVGSEAIKWGYAVDLSRTRVEHEFYPDVVIDDFAVMDYDPPDVHVQFSVQVPTSVLSVAPAFAHELGTAGYMKYSKCTEIGKVTEDCCLDAHDLRDHTRMYEAMLQSTELVANMRELWEEQRSRSVRDEDDRDHRANTALQTHWKSTRWAAAKTKELSSQQVTEQENSGGTLDQHRLAKTSSQHRGNSVDTDTLLKLLRPIGFTRKFHRVASRRRDGQGPENGAS